MNSICGISLNRALIVSALVALLALPCAAQDQPAASQGTAKVGSQKHMTAEDTIARERIAAGFAVIGPLELKGASSSELVVDDSPNESKTISLKNRKITVLDISGSGLTMSAVTAGKWVIICQKKDEVVIYLVKGYKKGTENAE